MYRPSSDRPSLHPRSIFSAPSPVKTSRARHQLSCQPSIETHQLRTPVFTSSHPDPQSFSPPSSTTPPPATAAEYPPASNPPPSPPSPRISPRPPKSFPPLHPPPHI